MRPRPVADFLISFRQEGEETPAEFEPPPFAMMMPEPHTDPQPLIEAARLEGWTEGLALAKAEAEAKLSEERLSFESRLEAERATWVHEEGDRLALLFGSAIHSLEATIADAVARILKPFVLEASRHKMVDDLVSAVQTLMKGESSSLVEVRAPDDLLHELRMKLIGFPTIEFIQTESPDVTIVANQTIVESQLAAWAERLNSLSE